MIVFVNNTSFQISDDEVFSYDSNGYINSPSTTHEFRGRKFDRIIPGDLRNFNEININGVRTFYNKKHVVNYNNKVDKPIEKKTHQVIEPIEITHRVNILGKLIYQIISKDGDIIRINNITYDTNIDDVFRIFLDDNKYRIDINDKEVEKLESLDSIDYSKESETNNTSIYLDISLLKKCVENKVNFDFILEKYINSGLDIDICISHSEKGFPKFLDKIIMRNKVNYLFISDDFKFTDDKISCISNNDKVIINGENIYLPNETILDMLNSKFDGSYVGDVIKTNKLNKYDFINYGILPKGKKSNDIYSIIYKKDSIKNKNNMRENLHKLNTRSIKLQTGDIRKINKLYYINIDHRLDRKIHMEKLINDCGLSDISERVSASYIPKTPELGCIQSHIICLEKFITSGEDYCIILEDDFITDNRGEFLNNINRIFSDNIDFDLIQISGNHAILHECEFEYLRKVSSSQTTSGYIVNSKFAKELLNNYITSRDLIINNGVRHEYCLDQYWKLLQPKSKWFCFYPALGYQMDGYSDIVGRNTSYKC